MNYGIATDVVTWYRATAVLLESSAPAASMAPTRQPVRETPVQVHVTGSPVGTVTVRGTVSGVTGSEVLTWTGAPGYRFTRKRFTALTNAVTSLTGATAVEMTAVGPDGSPQLALSAIRTGLPVVIDERSTGSAPARVQGDQEERDILIQVDFEETWTPRRGDRVTTTTGQTYEVQRVQNASGGGLSSPGWSCAAKRLDAKGP